MKNMKKTGVVAAVLIVALVMTGVVSALASNEKTEKTIMIRGIGPDTAMTSDGQVVKVIFHNINNEILSGTDGMDANYSSKFLTTNETRVHKFTIRVEPTFDKDYKNDEIVMIGSFHNSSSLLPK
ncbi:hypothetical protein [Methanoregula sp.]|uniref:hypothetical protein n=1 Tax=Methanoregula sp. TaxID=2052170 RepID=UPI002370E4A5|nr:hypothetical protein [Methanoregula sp.]MDD1686285.1 hypothetical protein [Methanoregula sp.]